MKRSDQRILTTHTGSLPRPADLVEALNAKELGQSHDARALDSRVSRAIAEIVQRQADTGLDVINDGEHSKVSWMAYARGRLSGLEEIDSPVRFRGATRNSLAFPAAYEDMKVMLAGRSSAIVAKRTVRPKAWVCSGPIAYVGQSELRADIDNLKAALKGVKAEEAFVTAISPSNLELYYDNQYYGSAEEYLDRIGRRHARRVQSHRRRRICAADRRSADGDALQSHAGCVDRGLPQVHGAARRGRQSRAARHSAGPRALSHLLQRQYRAARVRLRAEAFRRLDAADPRRRLCDRSRQSAARARMGAVARGALAGR